MHVSYEAALIHLVELLKHPDARVAFDTLTPQQRREIFKEHGLDDQGCDLAEQLLQDRFAYQSN